MIRSTKMTSRALAVALRTYHRPIQGTGGILEDWSMVVDRVISHQRWLWERAASRPLKPHEIQELEELRNLILWHYITPAGRTLWMGGTEVSHTRESSMFNCAYTHVETPYDVVDVLWLLLQGCGVGYRPIPGTLHGFRLPLEQIIVRRTSRTSPGGLAHNIESFEEETQTWTIKLGDCPAAWAKALGKLLAGKFRARTLILDCSEIGPAGARVKGYGWLSSGDERIASAFKAIATILSDKTDQLLTRINILDIINWLGTIPTGRHAALIALFEYGRPEWEEFAVSKKEWWLHGNAHRQLSNNSLLFRTKPTTKELSYIFELMLSSGGSEPGFINANEAERRGPWFEGCNPCGEIILGNKSFCNLTEINLLAFLGDTVALERAIALVARMNYRQTMVNLRDEILQEAWHHNNDFLHLCGVSLTGIRARPDITDYYYRRMRNIAINGAYSMANELNAPLPKNVTCVKPSGTVSKVMGTEEWGEVPEGVHKPLGKYMFNNITFSKHDPLVQHFIAAGYTVIEKPHTVDSVLVCFPVRYEHIDFTRVSVTHKNNLTESVEINTETAVDQLNWYSMLQRTWCEQNVSNTISYDPSEVPAIVNWLSENWDDYVGVTFILRNDPTKNAADLGYAYLPQEVVSEATYNDYVARLKEVDYSGLELRDDELAEECATGTCPVR